MMNFAQTLEIGKTGESLVAQYFLRLGYSVLPVYEKAGAEHKGPVLFSAASGPLIAPDMLVFNNKETLWIEVKHKSAFTWHRVTGEWVTGIDLHHYQQYLLVQKNRPEWQVWLLFLHENGLAKDTPAGKVPPFGLFGNHILYLSDHEHHRHANHGTGGMVYWSLDALRRSKSFVLPTPPDFF